MTINKKAPKASQNHPGSQRPKHEFEFAATIAFLELEIAEQAGHRPTYQAALDELRQHGWDVQRCRQVVTR